MGAYGLSMATVPNGDAVADYEISPTSHEMSETITDPFPNTGWVDPQNGNEIGDICAYVFGSLTPQGGDITLHGDQYLIQQEWSNTGGTGNKGACLSGYHRPATLPVNSTADSVAANGTTPLCPNTPGGDTGSNSKYILRCAIGDADNDALASTPNHTITFGNCGQTCSIKLGSALPNLAAYGLTLNGGGTALLNGNHQVTSGLVIRSSHATVKGLTLENVKGNAITASGTVKSTTIGGAEPNTIINNSGYGAVIGSSSTDASNALISKNVMYGNTLGGIYLDGLSAASCASGTTGSPNAYLACPTITSALPSAVAGTSSCTNSCTVELFQVPTTADKSGHGQAQKYLGSGTTTAAGTWTVTPSSTLTASSKVTATVTNTSTGQTSEFAFNKSVS